MGTLRTDERLEALFAPEPARGRGRDPGQRPARRGRGGGGRLGATAGRRRRRPTLERPQAGRVTATTRPTPRCCSRRLLASRRARSPSGWAARCATRLGDGAGARRGRRARASSTSSSPTRGTPRRCDGCWRPATATAAAAPTGPSASTSSSSRANPTGPLTAASGRHAAYGDALARLLELRRPRRSSASTTSTTPARRSSKLGESIRARARGEEVPEDGYEGDYVAELAERDPRRGRRATPTTLAARGVELMLERIRATLRALPRRLRPLLLRARAARGHARARSSAAFARAVGAGPHLPLRGRAVAAHDRRSATTRTACSSARPASRPTSPPTSPTTRTSASAASTC